VPPGVQAKHQPDSATAIIEYLILVAFIALAAATGVRAMSSAIDESLRTTMQAIEASSGLPVNCGEWGEPPC